MKNLYSILFLLMISQTFLKGQHSNQLQKIISSDRAVSDYFGRAVAISQNYLVVGSTLEDEDPSGQNTMNAAGAAYIYEKDTNTGSWNQVQKIVASDRDGGDRFGHAVSISGDYLVVGVSSESEDVLGGNTMNNAGSAYIFERNVNGVWNQVQKIVASDRDGGDRFGHAVSISGDYLVVGAYQESEDVLGGDYKDEAGSAYVFERNVSGVWNQTQKIVASDRAEDDYFAQDVSLSGNYMVLGAFRESHNALGQDSMKRAGSAYVFERSGNGVWNQVQKIVASDRGENDYFGEAVSISGDYIIIGASSDSEDALGGNPLTNAGSAYLFERSGNGVWNQVQKIVASDRATTDYFAESIDIYGNYAIVGAEYESEDSIGGNTMTESGSAYIFERNASGVWNQVQKIVSSDRASYDHFGRAVAISENSILIGAPDEDEDLMGNNTMTSAGSVYLFDKIITNNIFSLEEEELTILFYPNPISKKVIIDLRKVDFSLEMNLFIRSIGGQLIYQKNIVNQEFEEVDMEKFNSGIYFLSLYTSKGVITAKLIKE